MEKHAMILGARELQSQCDDAWFVEVCLIVHIAPAILTYFRESRLFYSGT
jgi:hypothetical protein